MSKETETFTAMRHKNSWLRRDMWNASQIRCVTSYKTLSVRKKRMIYVFPIQCPRISKLNGYVTPKLEIKRSGSSVVQSVRRPQSLRLVHNSTSRHEVECSSLFSGFLDISLWQFGQLVLFMEWKMKYSPRDLKGNLSDRNGKKHCTCYD